MNERTDQQLLSDYAERQSEAAFAAIVHRYVDLIFSAALRMLRDAHLAQDVTQGVFVALAKQAHQLADRPVLAGWLHGTAQNIAAQTVRADVRRRTREQEAALMHELLSANPDANWEHIAPHLDAALGELSEPDRDAVLLRYFKNQDLRTVGESLGISDDAAQKRVSRAVERLREFFAKRGITVGASGLAVVISANGVQAAPVGLALTISAAAVLTGTALTTTATATATKAIAMTALQKTIVTATVAALAGVGIYEARQAVQLREQVQTLRQQQAPLAGQVEQLNRALADATNQFARLRDENERLNRNTADLLKLRAEITKLRRDSNGSNDPAVSDTSDPTTQAAVAWVQRVKTLRQRFEQWPGRKTPELQLLSEQDWLNEAAARKFDSDADVREAMSSLRWKAKNEFSKHVNTALTKFIKDNGQNLPTDPAELAQYLGSPANTCLSEWQVAKPGWVHPPQPNAPESERSTSWALIEKGSFTPDGVAVRDGSYVADPNFDMTVVIYQGGCYGYGPDKPVQKPVTPGD